MNAFQSKTIDLDFFFLTKNCAASAYGVESSQENLATELGISLRDFFFFKFIFSL